MNSIGLPVRKMGVVFPLPRKIRIDLDNIADIDDRGIQTLLREITNDTLLLALRGADDSFKEKIFNNMSRRAAEMLRDDLDAAAPARLSDVETAQKEILGVARRLADSGEITLGGGDEFI